MKNFLLKTALVFFLVLPLSSLCGQSARTFGLQFDSVAYCKVPLIPLPGGRKGFQAPRSISLRPFCPIPADQRGISACTGFATGYGALTIAYAIRHRLHDQVEVTRRAFSAAFLYNQVKKKPGDCQEGVTTEATLRLLKEKGDCRFSEFDQAGICTRLPDPALADSARRNRIRDFASVLPLNSNSTFVIETLRTYLRDSVPVVLVMKAYRDFVFPRAGTPVWVKRQNDTLLALHCLVVVGYDEPSQTFEVMSSWGSQWGNGGFYKIGYLDMGEVAVAAYVLFPNGREFSPSTNMGANKPPKVLPKPGDKVMGAPTLGRFSLQGTFQLMRVDEELDDPFVPAAVQRDSATQLYFPVHGSFPLGFRYQLHTSGTGSGQYIYVFSADAQGKVELHYPKPAFSPLNPGSHALIAIPSAQTVLALVHPGADFVVILYSEVEIPDIGIRLLQFKGYDRQNFMAQLRQAFAGVLIETGPAVDIKYSDHQMNVHAQASTEQNGVAVPLVLCLEAH